MQKTSKLLWSCIAGISAVVCLGAVNANAAGGRAMSGGVNAGRSIARMPTMPTISINTVGTHAVSDVTYPETPTPTPTPEPTPEPTPDTPSDCPDGGVRNSEFTVDNCMQSLLMCVQSGVLPNGLNDLFNEDLRNSIINGMGLCASQVDKCIHDVRVDCDYIYHSTADVWLDFNSRIVQPEYYNFVLRKTGLTPHQAENVCWLLDKNTYGKSFAAVSASDQVTSEYNQKVGAYNSQMGGVLIKANPLGATVNTTANGNTEGVDGERGHYARWDATNAVCKVRVAAYNKDQLITNKWLFGAVGDDKAAEVWQDAGSSFTCNKDLFDFSLMNKTKTAAVIALPGGALLGAGIGAATGHKAHSFNCENKDARKELWKEIQKSGFQLKLNNYLSDIMADLSSEDGFDEVKCQAVVDLYNRYERAIRARDICQKSDKICKLTIIDDGIKSFSGEEIFDTCGALDKVEINRVNGTARFTDAKLITAHGSGDLKIDPDSAEMILNCKDTCRTKKLSKSEYITVDCSFVTLKNGGNGALDDEIAGVCHGGLNGCVNETTLSRDIAELKVIFDKLTVLQKGTKDTRGKNAAIGAGIGVGAGGIATAITAFVEKNNISCHVGDGLNAVPMGKSYTIDSLKDFYVKWNLRVADSINPTARVTSCLDWINTCGLYKTEEECKAVEINYQRPNRNTTVLVRSACVMSGSVCIENRPVAVSYGACDPDEDPTEPGEEPGEEPGGEEPGTEPGTGGTTRGGGTSIIQHKGH